MDAMLRIVLSRLVALHACALVGVAGTACIDLTQSTTCRKVGQKVLSNRLSGNLLTASASGPVVRNYVTGERSGALSLEFGAGATHGSSGGSCSMRIGSAMALTLDSIGPPATYAVKASQLCLSVCPDGFAFESSLPVCDGAFGGCCYGGQDAGHAPPSACLVIEGTLVVTANSSTDSATAQSYPSDMTYYTDTLKFDLTIPPQGSPLSGELILDYETKVDRYEVPTRGFGGPSPCGQ
jgi:hypothetical protein